MFKSIFREIQAAFDYGSMLTKLIIINVGVYVVMALIKAFMPEIYATSVLPYLALPGDLNVLLHRPWTILTHFFLHDGFWHIAFNMLVLYWFGNIAGDLLGDKRILPVYIMGGLVGALFFLGFYQLSTLAGSMAFGASAAVLAIVFMAIITAPDYEMQLILLGRVKIKYIGLAILFFDFINTASSSNAGGHVAHLGGALSGILYVWLLRNGTDLSALFNYRKSGKRSLKKPAKHKSNLRISHKATTLKERTNASVKANIELQVDVILEKIKANGYDSLTEEEKETLYLASKK